MVITIDELQAYTGDNNPTILDEMFLTSAQTIVEDFIGWKLEETEIEEEADISSKYYFANSYILEVTSLKINDVVITDYVIKNNCIKFGTYQSGTLVINYLGGIETIPNLIKLATLQIATLKLMETGKKIGVTGTQLPDGMGHTFINYTNYEKYLTVLKGYRIP